MDKLPKSWKDLTIKQFIEVSLLTEKGGDDIDIKIKLLCALTGKPEDFFLSLDYKKFNQLCGRVSFLNELKMSEKLVYSFKIDGISFVVNPNVSELSTAEYIDLVSFIGTKESIQTNLHKILAIFIKPKHKWFGLKKVYMSRGKVAELLLNKMSITTAYPLCVFFCNLLNNSTKITRDYLEKEMRKLKKQMEKETGSQKSGVGM